MAAVVTGERAGQPATVRVDVLAAPHAEWGVSGASLMVTAPPAIGAVWLAERRIDRPGVHPPETVIPPREFFAALAERGIRTTITRTQPL